MFRKLLSFGGMVLVAGAAAFVTPGSALAQHGGGGHFGGGHFGGGHVSSGHFGGARLGGYHGGYFGGGRYGHPRNYAYPRYGYRHYYTPYLGSYPYYGSYDYYPNSYYTDPDVWGSPADDPDSYSSAADQPDTNAHVTVNVPAGALLWFDGMATASTGQVREFDSPPLRPDRHYSYEVRARWSKNGHLVTQTQEVNVAPGANVSVSFPVPPKTAARVSAVKKAAE